LLISHPHKFIFIKTPKTAGTSVELLFERFCLPNETSTSNASEKGRPESVTEAGASASLNYNHMEASAVLGLRGQHIWDSYIKFSVVRNPFDQVVSYFLFSTKVVPESQSTEKIMETFRQWLPKHVLNLHTWYCSQGRQLDLDFYIKYEALEHGIQFVKNKIGTIDLLLTDLQHAKQSDNAHLPPTAC
jgi:hypothetical protein